MTKLTPAERNSHQTGDQWTRKNRPSDSTPTNEERAREIAECITAPDLPYDLDVKVIREALDVKDAEHAAALERARLDEREKFAEISAFAERLHRGLNGLDLDTTHERATFFFEAFADGMIIGDGNREGTIAKFCDFLDEERKRERERILKIVGRFVYPESELFAAIRPTPESEGLPDTPSD